MPDPASHVGVVLGVKLASVVAGFAGGVISLSFIKQLTKWQAFLAVATGSLTAGYMTPAIIVYIGTAMPEPSVAFIVGLTAMNLIPGLVRLAESFKKNPRGFLDRSGGDK